MASRKVIYVVAAAVGIAAASGAAWWWQKPRPATATVAATEARGAPGAPAPDGSRSLSVEAAPVGVMRLSDDAQTVGSLRSRRGVVLRPEVSGRITQLNFRDGERVKRGQVLVQFDDQLPLAQVQQSQAELSIAQANDKRNRELVAEGFISQRSVDESAANLQVAQAKLSLARATAARLRIVAPFDGTAGIRLVNVGDYLKDGADIVNIEDLDAMFVDFRLPERFQDRVRTGQLATVDLDALPGRHFSATVQAIDPLLDANGRSVAVRACIDNRAGALRPGMFARVNAVFGTRENARVIPEEAIVPQGARQSVWKVVGQGDQRTVQRVELRLGLRRPGLVEVVQGLEAGDLVVTAGQQRLQKDGAPVRVSEAATPAAQRPRVADVAPQAAGPALAGPHPCAGVQAAARATPIAAPAAPAAPAPAAPAPSAARSPA